MSDKNDFLNIQTLEGDSISVMDVQGGLITLTPQSQSLAVKWPNGGFVYNRPSAILVDEGDGTARIPIVDITRVAQIILWSLSAIFALLALSNFIRNSR